MRTLYDENNNPVEVPDVEEIEAYKSNAEKIQELEDKAKLADTLSADKNLINWQKARDNEKKLVAELKKHGKDMDEEGNFIDFASEKENQIRTIAMKEAKMAMLEERLNEELGRYAPESRDVVKKYFDKLTTGEEVSMSNVRSFLSEAEKLAIPNNVNPIMNRISNSQGGVPDYDGDKNTFAESEEGKSLAGTLGIKI